MIEPRKAFQASPLAVGWQSAVDGAQFHAAASTALLEMQLRRKRTSEVGQTAACQLRSEGAIEFLDILMRLMETEAKPVERHDHTLKM
jgi:uncharacterized membrane protein YfbV (UPF0208 family)